MNNNLLRFATEVEECRMQLVTQAHLTKEMSPRTVEVLGEAVRALGELQHQLRLPEKQATFDRRRRESNGG